MQVPSLANCGRGHLLYIRIERNETNGNRGGYIIYMPVVSAPVNSVNTNLKMPVFAEKACLFLPDSIQVCATLTTTSLVGLKPVKP